MAETRGSTPSSNSVSWSYARGMRPETDHDELKQCPTCHGYHLGGCHLAAGEPSRGALRAAEAIMAELSASLGRIAPTLGLTAHEASRFTTEALGKQFAELIDRETASEPSRGAPDAGKLRFIHSTGRGKDLEVMRRNGPNRWTNQQLDELMAQLNAQGLAIVSDAIGSLRFDVVDARSERTALLEALKHQLCKHEDTYGGNDFGACRVCGFEWDWSKVSLQEALRLEAEAVIRKAEG